MTRNIVLPEANRRTYNTFHFAPAVWSDTGLLLCSGVIGTGADGKIPDNPAEEFTNAWTAIGSVLSDAGLSYEDILEFTSFHVGMHDHLQEFIAVKDQFVQEPWPAWTAIGITELAVPGARVEVRVVARRTTAVQD
ncbi:MAG: Rid family hydrolase [Pseudomonadota bacterium]